MLPRHKSKLGIEQNTRNVRGQSNACFSKNILSILTFRYLTASKYIESVGGRDNSFTLKAIRK